MVLKITAMIPRMNTSRQLPAWQMALRQTVNSVEELLRLVGLEATGPDLSLDVREFPLRVTHSFIRRMERGNRNDPLLRQVLPVHEEWRDTPGFQLDPLGEREVMATPGLLHKYNGRALLTLTGACAVHCRYCFRRHFPYGEANPAAAHRDAALAYLEGHEEISEVILSGGDPLALPDERLGELARRLALIPHVRTLRIHTRLPIVLPERIDDVLLAWLASQPKRMVLVVHCNHPNEIDDEVSGSMRKLKQSGVTLLNQTVLLKGINDDAVTLTRLSERLFDAGILPYYLHQLDRVRGGAHFEVTDGAACELMDSLHATLPGYLVPRLARETPGARGKQLLWPARHE
jgi:EF-P beta-lysylation protein EpmB